jgi:hypothetical protein
LRLETCQKLADLWKTAEAKGTAIKELFEGKSTTVGGVTTKTAGFLDKNFAVAETAQYNEDFSKLKSLKADINNLNALASTADSNRGKAYLDIIDTESRSISEFASTAPILTTSYDDFMTKNYARDNQGWSQYLSDIANANEAKRSSQINAKNTAVEEKQKIYNDMLNTLTNLQIESATKTSYLNSLSASTGISTDALAKGTSFARGGITLVGEQGPELVRMPRGSKVSTAQETKRMGTGVTVNINSPTQLNPVESAALMRQSMRQLSFQGAF